MRSNTERQSGFDERIVKVSIEINGKLKTYTSPLNITAVGVKYGNALQNECVLTIDNLDRATQDYLATETSPFNENRTPKTVIIEAGRKSYGTSVIYTGNIIYATVSQPPDTTVTLKCLTGNFMKGSLITRNQPGMTTHLQICQQIAQDIGLVLQYEASDKNIANYAFSGGALEQVELAGTLGNYNVFVDNDVLIVKDSFIPLTGSVRKLSMESGLIGIPQFTERGLSATFLIDNITKLGGAMEITSKQYPAANGVYVIYKLGFNITSRDVPFYYVAEGSRIPERRA